MSRKGFVVLFLVLASAGAVTAHGRNLSLGKPDLTISIESDGVLAVRNIGTADVPSNFTVHVTCTVTTASTRGQTCGAPFVNGVYEPNLTLPSGHGNAPIKLSPGQQTYIQYGPGWAMIYPAMLTWKKGTYKFTAKVDSTNKISEVSEANNDASAPVTKK